MILETLEVGPFLTNCYIVGSEKTREGMIIDPGAEGGRILARAKRLNLSIALIMATHAHIDHIGALSQVKEATKAQFTLHEAEGTGELMQAFTRMYSPFLGVSFRPPPKPDRLLQEGDKIELGELSFIVLHTPGHSPGGISLLGHGIVFCGDTLFNYSIGRTDFPGCSFTQLMNSIYTKLMVLPDETKVLPGHGPETTIGFERKWNPFLNTPRKSGDYL